MSSDVSISRMKQFPLLMWILLFGSFITRGSFYMVWPFLAVILYEKFSLTATEVGLILSVAAIVSVLISFVGSALSDRIGRKKLMYFSGLLYIISFSLLAEIDHIEGYIIVITLCSIATALWRPLISALIGDMIDDSKTRELAMQSLYFVVNVGCAVGPMLGVWMGLTGEQSSFYITAMAFVFLLCLLSWGFHQHEKKEGILVTNNNAKKPEALEENTAQNGLIDENEAKNENVSFKEITKILLKDKLFQCLILANLFCFFIYGQMDSSLIQYLTRAEVPELLMLISTIIFTNAMVIIATQFIMLRMMAHLSLTTRIQIGLVLLTVSQLWMGLNPVSFFWGWIGAVIIMSLAETILFPTMNVQIDRIAPQHLRGAYFGASSFYDFGFALAPLGGGLILDYFGGSALFIFSAVLSLVVIYLYAILHKMPRPDFVTTERDESLVNQ
ncbi:MDR family MFS transporter [Litorilituus lipolyticus]|uniref:MFS transporter n=1 Tax=Litorilituus lipolyticus TaxID=2491017 RepID=A0A502L2C7_9GAMM|nr:MFS transporter [Litorilituus lipolyticus]TPH18068.1 MFS transporter [Litorilituus lipolyticus]